jgi:hypothetical protein
VVLAWYGEVPVEFSWTFWGTTLIESHCLARPVSIHRHAGLCGSVGLCPPSVAGGAVAPWRAQEDAPAIVSDFSLIWFCNTEKSVVPSTADTHDLAIDDRRACADQESVVCDFLESLAPVVAVAGKDVSALVGNVELDPVAVELDRGSSANRSGFSRSRWRPPDR